MTGGKDEHEELAMTDSVAEVLFHRHQTTIYQRTDRLFGFILVVQWVMGILASLVLSPLTWQGSTSFIHPHVYAAVLLGGAITSFPLFLIKTRPGKPLTRHVVAISQMLFSSLFIAIAGGRIETHFHVFGSLAVLAFYRDWRVLLTASAVVGTDHLLRGLLWPQSVFGTPVPSPWRALEHTAWVLFEDIFLCMGIKQNVQEMRDIARQSATVDAQAALKNKIVAREVLAQTERLQASEQEARQLAAIVEQSDDAIMRLDLAGRIRTWNRGAVRLFGYTAEQMVGTRGEKIGLNRASESENPILENIKSGQSVENLETVCLRNSGEEIEVAVTLSPIKSNDGALQAASMVIRDITQKKLVERRISEFYSVVSHELRTPLTSIRGALALIADGIVDQTSAEAAELIGIARTSTNRLVRLINDILDLRKIEAGKFELEINRVNTADLIEESAQSMLGFAEERHVKLKAECEKPVDLELDRDRITQVLSNLLSNAIKYAPEGSTVLLRCAEVGAAVRFEVVDNGPGIPVELQGQLFQKFQQIDSSDSRTKEGTGLGLAVCKAMIEQHGGRIGFTSNPGQPTTFWFELSSHRRAKQATGTYQALRNTSAERFAPRVLIVEDDRELSAVLKFDLEKKGYTCRQGYSLSEARTLLQEELPHAVILDLGLPDGSGLDLINELRESDRAEMRALSVVVVTGSDSAQGSYSRPAVCDWLAKPFDPDAFYSAIERAVSQKSGRKKVLLVENDQETRRVISEQLKDIKVEFREVNSDHFVQTPSCDWTPDLIIFGTGDRYIQPQELCRISSFCEKTSILFYSSSELGEARRIADMTISRFLPRIQSEDQFLTEVENLLQRIFDAKRASGALAA